jgi:hypothetical protein
MDLIAKFVMGVNGSKVIEFAIPEKWNYFSETCWKVNICYNYKKTWDNLKSNYDKLWKF